MTVPSDSSKFAAGALRIERLTSLDAGAAVTSVIKLYDRCQKMYYH